MRTLPIRFIVLALLSVVLVAGCGQQPAPTKPGTTVYTYRGHPYGIGKVNWLPDGKYIVSQDFEHNIHVWEAMTGKLIRSINTGRNSTGSVLSPDGKYIAIGFDDQTVKVSDIMTGRTLLTYTGISTFDWSPDGKYIATSNDLTMQVRDAKTGETKFTYIIPPKTEIDTRFNFLWSPDSKYIAVGGITKTVLVFDAMTGKVSSTYNGHTEVGASPFAWSPDSKYIVSESWDLTTQVWEVMTGKNVHTFDGIAPVAWSPDGKYIVIGSFTKRGEMQNDNNFNVLDTKTWKTLLTYSGHKKGFEKDGVFYPQGLTTVAWSPDSKYIASGSEDKTVQVWLAP